MPGNEREEGNFGESNFASQSAKKPSRLITGAEDQIRIWILLTAVQRAVCLELFQ